MSAQSLGMIETWGYVAAVEALDAGMKAANVISEGVKITPSALVTVSFIGDVSAVKTAVLAGVAAAQKVGRVVSCHVIPRPDTQLSPFISGPEPSAPSRPLKKEITKKAAKVESGPASKKHEVKGKGRTGGAQTESGDSKITPGAGTKTSKKAKQGKKAPRQKGPQTKRATGRAVKKK
jgi:microcompartment protein CcmL/EutN